MDRLEAVHAGLEESSIPLVYVHIGFTKAAAVKYDDAHMIIVDKEQVTSRAEELCLTVHEKSHCLTGALYCIDAHPIVQRKCEVRATKRTIKELVPRTALQKLAREGIDDIFELAEHFDVTPDMIRQAIDFYTNGYIA